MVIFGLTIKGIIMKCKDCKGTRMIAYNGYYGTCHRCSGTGIEPVVKDWLKESLETVLEEVEAHYAVASDYTKRLSERLRAILLRLTKEDK